MISGSRGFDDNGSFYVDETGVVRYEQKGDAGPGSTPLRDIEAAEAEAERNLRDARAAAGAEALVACEKGDAAACDRYAEHATFDLNQHEELVRYFKRACDGGHALGYLSLSPMDPAANESFHTSMWLRKQCRDGHARACEALAKLRPGMTREETRQIEDWALQAPSPP